MSQRGIRAVIAVSLRDDGIWFCRVITVETAHLTVQKLNKTLIELKDRFEEFNMSSKANNYLFTCETINCSFPVQSWILGFWLSFFEKTSWTLSVILFVISSVPHYFVSNYLPSFLQLCTFAFQNRLWNVINIDALWSLVNKSTGFFYITKTISYLKQFIQQHTLPFQFNRQVHKFFLILFKSTEHTIFLILWPSSLSVISGLKVLKIYNLHKVFPSKRRFIPIFRFGTPFSGWYVPHICITLKIYRNKFAKSGVWTHASQFWNSVPYLSSHKVFWGNRFNKSVIIWIEL